MACGILVPWPGIEPVPPALEAWSLNHWTTREVPVLQETPLNFLLLAPLLPPLKHGSSFRFSTWQQFHSHPQLKLSFSDASPGWILLPHPLLNLLFLSCLPNINGIVTLRGLNTWSHLQSSPPSLYLCTEHTTWLRPLGTQTSSPFYMSKSTVINNTSSLRHLPSRQWPLFSCTPTSSHHHFPGLRVDPSFLPKLSCFPTCLKASSISLVPSRLTLKFLSKEVSNSWDQHIDHISHNLSSPTKPFPLSVALSPTAISCLHGFVTSFLLLKRSSLNTQFRHYLFQASSWILE